MQKIQEEQQTADEFWIGSQEVCRRLGIGTQTLYWLVYSKKIPHFKVGRKLRFSWPEVRDKFRAQQ